MLQIKISTDSAAARRIGEWQIIFNFILCFIRINFNLS